MNPISKLALGTAQFGTDYGIANTTGMISTEDVKSIMTLARQAHSSMILDTAPVYGESESVLGAILKEDETFNAFRVVTKSSGSMEACEAVFTSSRERLKIKCFYGYLDHNGQNLKSESGAAMYGFMKDTQERGEVLKIGASVYTAEDIDFLLENYDLDIIQLPLNILDQRLLQSGHLRKLKDRNVEIHARSVFLQGALLLPIADLPPFLAPYRSYFEHFHDFCRAQDISPSKACLDFVLSLKYVDAVIVGIDCLKQWKDHLLDAKNVSSFKPDNLACPQEFVISPAQWPQTKKQFRK